MVKKVLNQAAAFHPVIGITGSVKKNSVRSAQCVFPLSVQVLSFTGTQISSYRFLYLLIYQVEIQTGLRASCLKDAAFIWYLQEM